MVSENRVFLFARPFARKYRRETPFNRNNLQDLQEIDRYALKVLQIICLSFMEKCYTDSGCCSQKQPSKCCSTSAIGASKRPNRAEPEPLMAAYLAPNE